MFSDTIGISNAGRNNITKATPLLFITCLLALQTTAVNAEDNWSLYGRTHDNQRYSPLAAINSGNVASLQPAWCIHTGKKGSFQATPIVHDGIMYLSTPFNNVLAIAADSGKILWRYEHGLPERKFCCGPANRGVAVSADTVFMATLDSRLVALDKTSGKKIWETAMADSSAGTAESAAVATRLHELRGARYTGHTGYSANMAPQLAGNLVLAGITGAGYGLHLETGEDGDNKLAVSGMAGGGHGLRGFIAAYEQKSGRELWRWYSVPEQGWEGQMQNTTGYGVPLQRDLKAETRNLEKYSDSWQFGGGSIWTTPAVDLERGLVFLGTGNPSPQMEDSTRPGDNLYTVSLVALDLHSGELRWHYQQVPHDRWGYDVASPPVLMDVKIDGKKVAAVAQASKLGWLFVHDRNDGKLLRRSKAFVPQENMFTPPTADGVRITPGTLGATSWSPASWHPELGLFYVAAIHQPSLFFSRPLAPTAEQPWTHISFFQPAPGADNSGNVSAIDPTTGEITWQNQRDNPLVGGVLSTAGNLVFTGEGEGQLIALDAASGKELWQHQVPYGVNAPPISYSVDGRQYIAVAAGGNRLFGYPTGDLVVAYRIPDAGDATVQCKNMKQ